LYDPKTSGGLLFYLFGWGNKFVANVKLGTVMPQRERRNVWMIESKYFKRKETTAVFEIYAGEAGVRITRI
jgi:hypothetical protein